MGARAQLTALGSPSLRHRLQPLFTIPLPINCTSAVRWFSSLLSCIGAVSFLKLRLDVPVHARGSLRLSDGFPFTPTCPPGLQLFGSPSTKERASALPNPQLWPILVSDTDELHFREKGSARAAPAQVRRPAELHFTSPPPLLRHTVPTRAPELTEMLSMTQHNDIRTSILRRRKSASSTSSFRLQTLPT
jgi:hypothetical protein